MLKFNGIVVLVNGYTLNNGSPYFQKAVPVDLRQRLGKATIKRPLKHPTLHPVVLCERLNNQYTALFKAMRDDSALVPSDAKLAAMALLAEHGLREGDGLRTVHLQPGDKAVGANDQPHLDELHQTLRELVGDDVYFKGGDTSVVVTNTLSALNGTMPVLLSEAFTVYAENHRKGNDAEFVEAQRKQWDKLIKMFGDIAFSSLNRQHAKGYRDARLATGIKPVTVGREISVLSAVVTAVCNELDLSLKNPFARLTIQRPDFEEDRREPYSREQVVKLVERARAIDDERRRLVLVLAVTGARLAEIVGLRKIDYDVQAGSISIVRHASRSLKTDTSTRVIPLLSVAKEALDKQLKASPTEFLFPSYANDEDVKADSASAILNKWARVIVPGRTMHCFRHTLRDQLREVVCPEAIAKEIGGWSQTQDVSVHYGSGYPLEIKREWLARAYSWLV